MYKNWCNVILLLIFAGLFSMAGCSKGVHKVQMTSDPSGAIVSIEEEEIGMTPFQAVIQERHGDYNIYEFHALKEDYLPSRKAYKEEFYYEDVHDAVPETVHFILQKREKHKVEITSKPAGAEILFDSVSYGETPCTLLINQSNKYPAVFKIIARKKGYKTTVETIQEIASEKEKWVFEAPDAVHLVLKKED